jgi:hypothetical protein
MRPSAHRHRQVSALVPLAAGLALCAATMTGARIPSVSSIMLVDVTPRTGVTFRLEHHPTPEKHLIETMPGGLAAFDYNRDGRTDLYFTNGASVPGLVKDGAAFWNRLYRNDGDMKFTDVTAEAGVAGKGYSMGAATADYDNDGHIDLLVTGVRENTLYRNTGSGRFEDVTARAGVRGGAWSVAAGWLDFDRDGLLDLFVVNYLKWSAADARFCGDRARNMRVYCDPRYYTGLPNTLYRNRGDGIFEDVSVKTGIAAHVGKGMSLGVADYDGDGWTDVFVTNDTVPNFLFRNIEGRRFDETALLSGVSVPSHGRPVSSMGAEFRDVDNDGRPDIHVTALAGETFPLFQNDGGGTFRDTTQPSGIAAATLRHSGWGNALVDLDNDGWRDLFTANSHVNDRIEAFEAHSYLEPNGIFRNTGRGRFVDVTKEVGAAFAVPRAHRGAIAADLNSDGRVDIVTTSLGDRAEIWENRTAAAHWIILKLVGRPNRDAIGAHIRIGNQTAELATTAGYASSVHAGVHFGLGSATTIARLEIRWPDGTIQVLNDVRADQVLEVRQSSGSAGPSR